MDVTCDRCGGQLGGGVPLGVCPRCLLRLALPDDDLAVASAAADPASCIGPYRLLEPLGEGGMGVVYLAEQTAPFRRRVALKLIKPGLVSGQVTGRFAVEQQTLARLNHPAISGVYDAGLTSDARPYVVMEYVPGVPITQYCDERRLSIGQRMHLFLQVCAAIQHAHQKAVIHRDLKPSNVLVTASDGAAAVKVIDFGLAKVLDDAGDADWPVTRLGLAAGTPEYMSPEQASPELGAVDTRSDIYALGVLLYELLVGARPFELGDRPRASPLLVLEAVREGEPVALTARLRGFERATGAAVAARRLTDRRTLERRLRGELEWITSRALEKRPDERYQSVAELAEDVRRHLHGDPLTVGPPTAWYRLRKLMRRHRAGAVAVAAVAAALTLGSVVSTVALVRALRAEDEIRRALVRSLVMQGMQRVDAFDPVRGLVYLTRALELESDPARVPAHRIRIAETQQRSPWLRRLWRHDGAITLLAVSSSGLVATGAGDGAVRLWELQTGDRRGDLARSAAVTGGGFAESGAHLLAVYADGMLRVIETERASVIREVSAPGRVVDAALSPEATALAAAGDDGAIRVWDVASGRLQFERRHDGESYQVLFSHSGRELASVGADGLRVWNGSTGEPIAGPFRHEHERIRDVAFADDDRLIVTAGLDFAARLWDWRRGVPLGPAMRHGAHLTGVVFANDSDLLVTTAGDGTTSVWRVADGAPVGGPRRSASIANKAAVSRHGFVATPTQSGIVDLWSLAGDRPATAVPHDAVTRVAFDRDGRFLVTAGADGLTRVWDLAPALSPPARIVGEEREFHWRVVAAGDSSSVAVSFASLPDRGAARVFDARTGMPVTPVMRLPGFIHGLALSPDGTRLVTASTGGSARVWNVRTGEPVTPPTQDPTAWRVAAVAPGGGAFVTAGGDEYGGPVGAARLRDANGAASTPPLSHGGRVMSAVFSADGRRLLTTAQAASASVKMWDASTGSLLWAAHHANGSNRAVWSPDRMSVLTAGMDQHVRAWSGISGEARGTVLRMLGPVTALDVSRDGRRLIAGTDGGDVRLAWLDREAPPISVMRHHGFVYETLFSPDGLLALTSAGDMTARLWHGATGEPLTPQLPSGSISRGAAFLDGGRAWAWTGDGVFVDDLSTDERAVAAARQAAEIAAARSLAADGTEVVLTADDVTARFAAEPVGPDPMAPAFLARVALEAWRTERFADAVTQLELLRARAPLYWPDRMRLLGAYAMVGRWRDAVVELRRLEPRWPAAPELMFMEAVALAGLGETAAVRRQCRKALDATRATRHPERAYWAARACLVSTVIAADEREAVGQRIELAYERMPHTWGRAEMRAAALLRGGHATEAAALLAGGPVTGRSRDVAMLAAAAAANAGRRQAALAFLQAADSAPSPTTYRQLTPWFEGEIAALRREAVGRLAPRRNTSPPSL